MGVAMLFVAAVIIVITALRRPRMPEQGHARHDPRAGGSATSPFGLGGLGPGAMVGFGGVDYVVRGTVTFHEGPFLWREYLIEGDGAESLWFSVDDDDEAALQLVLWTSRPDLSLQPGGQHTVDGTLFHEQDRGHASYTAEGTTGLTPAGQMDFVEYSTDGETAFLGFERYGPDMPWELSIGKPVQLDDLTVYPAPSVSA
jgi:hypothetical protein